MTGLGGHAGCGDSVVQRMAEIATIGTDRTRGGYSRHLFAPAERELREWFTTAAQGVGLDVDVDRNGNLWAWWGTPADGAVVTGSHVDSVPGGGAFDGPLGVASALAAVARLRGEGFQPRRPIAVVVFAEEEGGRFGVPCLGSRLLTGAVPPERALRLTDGDGTTLADAATKAGFDPARFGRDDAALARIGTFVELHVEQGRGLIDAGSPVAVGTGIDPHGRWRFSFTGRGDHAGTAAVADRIDPMIPAARTVLAARAAAGHGPRDTRATVGRLVPVPGGTNVIPARVDLWLDSRAIATDATREAVAEITEAARAAAHDEGCRVEVTEESWSGPVSFDAQLRDRLRATLREPPLLPTGAGHDAGVLAAHVPTGMLYVRNPTGISHSPAEHAEDDDCEAGVEALADVLRELAA